MNEQRLTGQSRLTAVRWTAVAAVVALTVGACAAGTTSGPTAANGAPAPSTASTGARTTTQHGMTVAQTLSDEAQLTTIAFDGLAFLTGSLGSDSFFPPGKVADFWGFQYLRDNDPSGMGHNTDFLTRASLAVLSALSTDQRAQLVALAKSQVTQINEYGYDRFTLMSAFRRLLAGSTPAGSPHLDTTAVEEYSASLYAADGEISLQRATVMGAILRGLSTEQRAALDAMVGQGMTAWPVAQEPSDLRRLTGDEKVAVMTYAADLFSWYAGDVDADVYFCPERQGTYFGSFYLKDAKAVGNPGYSIGVNITADMGRAFLAVLTPTQRARITALVSSQRASLLAIVEVRRAIATELCKGIAGSTTDTATVQTLMRRYGALDGAIVARYATAFSAVGRTLTAAQRTKLMELRHRTIGDLSPKGAYLYAQPIPMPKVASTDFLFSH